MLAVLLLLKIPENFLECKQAPYFEQNQFCACLIYVLPNLHTTTKRYLITAIKTNKFYTN